MNESASDEEIYTAIDGIRQKKMNQAMSVLTSQKTVEWYSPSWIIELARKTLGTIDLDPCSNAMAQSWINATQYYSLQNQENGLTLPWHGRVWLNPPFSHTVKWLVKAYEEHKVGRIDACVFIVNSALGYNWYEELYRLYPVVLLRERVHFVQDDGTEAKESAKKGQTIGLIGGKYEYKTRGLYQRFLDNFAPLGRLLLPA